MKKAITALVLILILAGVGIPVFNGIMMERTLKQMFSQINQMYEETGAGISCEIINYDRSLFSSEIVWKISLGAIKSFYGTDEILFVNHAKHEFTRVVSTMSLEKNKWFMDFLDRELDGKNPLDIYTEYRYSGNLVIKLKLNSFDWEKRDEVFSCMPGQLTVTIGKDLRSFESKGTWEGFSLADIFTVNQVSMNSKMDKFSTYIWDGNAAFSAENIRAENEKGRFELSNVKCEYHVDFEKEENALSVKVGYGADRVTGGPIQIKDAFVEIGINHIDSNGFEEFMALYSQMMSSVMGEWPEESGKDPDEVKKDMEKQLAGLGHQMGEAYEKLLKQGLEFEISDLKATLPEGQIKGTFALGLKKDMTIAQFRRLATEPALALDIFSLKSDFSLPIKLIGENPQLLQPIFPGMQTGLFVKKGNNLIHHAETRKGKLFLNGLELQLQ